MDCTLSLHSPLQEGQRVPTPRKKEGLAQGFGDDGTGTLQRYTISVMPAEKVLGICCTVCIQYRTTHGSLRAQTTSSLANPNADFDLKMGSPEEGKRDVSHHTFVNNNSSSAVQMGCRWQGWEEDKSWGQRQAMQRDSFR